VEFSEVELPIYGVLRTSENSGSLAIGRMHREPSWYTLTLEETSTLERVMNSIRNALGMRETEMAREPS